MIRSFEKILITLFLSLSLIGHVSGQHLSWPPVTKENKPWTRWWWPGSIVTKADLTAAMEKYHDAGLGGLEITAIYGAKGHEDSFIDFLSPEWMEMFSHVLDESERLGLGIDMANASGWPFGGPWVEPGDACRNINYKTWKLGEGDSLLEKIEFIQQPLVRPVGKPADFSEIYYPISKNKNLQLHAFDQVRFEMPLTLTTLMAYSDRGDILDLTGKVTSGGRLDWVAGKGNWTLYALFTGWHGKMVERAGPGGEGDVIDHFSGEAINNYLAHFDEAFRNHDLINLRGYFNDSYEVDDASGQADWTNDLFTEFFLRRGYDLRNFLPALFQKDDPDKNARVLSDYRQTISDLLLDKFTATWTQWAHLDGKITRGQAHGSPGNILDLYAATDVPETEGNEITRFRFASSAANVNGKKYVSCEAATWLDEHFSSSLADVKKAVDLFFLGGINHVFYHGTCFSPQDEPWPGFLFYAATEFNPANPLWRNFRALNDYVTRTQSFLQSGKADNDILLYFPIFDRYAEYDKGLLTHFDALGPSFNNSGFKNAAEIMADLGFSYDYISDRQLAKTFFKGQFIETAGNVYKTLIIPFSKYIPAETFERVIQLANDGAKIIFFGDLPENISGWADKEKKTAMFNNLKEQLHFEMTAHRGVMKTHPGKGIIFKGNSLEQLLSIAGIERENLTDKGFGFIRRKTLQGTVYFLNNKSEKSFSGWLRLNSKGKSVALFNPMDNKYGMAVTRNPEDGGTELFLTAEPGESFIIKISDNEIRGNEYPFFECIGEETRIDGRWKIEFIDGGPVIPKPRETGSLISWTDMGDNDLINFSGTARYSLTFRKPGSRANAWILDLGKVSESADVSLNGSRPVTLIGPDYRILIDRKQIKRVNSLIVNVSNLMANRIAYMDRNNIPWKKFYNINMAARLKQNIKDGIFDASDWKPRESGLLGPVTITRVRKIKHREVNP